MASRPAGAWRHETGVRQLPGGPLAPGHWSREESAGQHCPVRLSSSRPKRRVLSAQPAPLALIRVDCSNTAAHCAHIPLSSFRPVLPPSELVARLHVLGKGRNAQFRRSAFTQGLCSLVSEIVFVFLTPKGTQK